MATWARKHIPGFSIRDCKIAHSFEPEPWCIHHNQFAEDCDEASRSTTMLIPGFTTNYTPAMNPMYVGVAFENHGNDHEIVWTAPVWRTSQAEALKDGQDAVESLAYERRHQLQLL